MSEEDNNNSNDQVDPDVMKNFEAKLRAEFQDEKDKILANRDEILEEKKNLQDKFKGLEPEDLEQFKALRAEAQNNELVKLASEGKIDELSNRLMQGQRAAWDETTLEYDSRLKEKDSLISGFELKINELTQQNTNMSKTQYLKDLTSTDDTFKGDYFGHFTKLYMDRLDIDEGTGSVYALDDRGKRMVDAGGELETFGNFYNKQKVKDGLFWNVGTGSGHISLGDGKVTKPLDQMSLAEKTELRQDIGEAAYAALLVKK